MDHHWPVELSIVSRIVQVKLIGKVKVHLYGRVGLLMSHHIGQLDIELRPIESRFATALFVGQP